jgi:hypothetical protein
MSRTTTLSPLLLIIAISSMTVLSCSAETVAEIDAPESIAVESAEFTDGAAILAQFTCAGEDVSPSLSWSAGPEGTESYALIVDDPDAPGGSFVHWVYYDIAPGTTELPARVPRVARPEAGGVQGTNGFRSLGYRGPCPPSGTHRYFFTVLALDTRIGLGPGATKNEVLEAAEGHILAKGSIMVRFTSQ